jgi:hypothetical protein
VGAGRCVVCGEPLGAVHVCPLAPPAATALYPASHAGRHAALRAFVVAGLPVPNDLARALLEEYDRLLQRTAEGR